MRTATVGQRTLSLSLIFVLVSCSATRYSVAGPTGPQDLARYAILFETQPDGAVIHTWKPVADIDLTPYQAELARALADDRLERTGARERKLAQRCQELGDLRYRQCLADKEIPADFDHYYAGHPDTDKGRWEALNRFCNDEGIKVREACYRAADAKRRVVRFDRSEKAVEWVKRNKEVILAGTIVVIAAVIFIAVVCANGGCLLLLPVILVADGARDTQPHLTGALL